ncbi:MULTISPECIES: CBS domain-containing protein [Flavobacterium]|uniref:CBS domain-containing protein n=1 Tax=Flavobacterium gawalongense TaxID=2594432 RepID=A0A553BX35_9FLAO|nr:CBS domain-containing protein [Flavobacterium gawalongense]TRX04251.1 CBS domain-containing protein [Flavobacterium gawalongense]TRX09300.1 CBS domain-containing protein [Flavobacterium gawalongense]TRX12887.1 CBS domain-containing protein [Flavobacterium gawalongense]TRX13231.1 CBS domain-containing protein [Flavobacterium gawalongense]TRX30707.1 CBS domain-containing protein [Flavobacterium gawalongense]
MTEITNYITNDFKAIDSQETIAVVQDFFNELHFSHFPVVEEGIYIGSIVSDDIETFDRDKKVIDYRFTLEGFFTRTNTIWLDVLEIFAKNHTNLVPVLDENNKYVGYYEIEDIMKFFHETPFLKEPGGIIVVKKPILDYSMSQITQIVESNNGKLLGLFISDADVDSVQVTMKISLGAMNEIIQTFRRYNYEIISEHQEDNYINNLKERSDYLDKYLNI